MRTAFFSVLLFLSACATTAPGPFLYLEYGEGNDGGVYHVYRGEDGIYRCPRRQSCGSSIEISDETCMDYAACRRLPSPDLREMFCLGRADAWAEKQIRAGAAKNSVLKAKNLVYVECLNPVGGQNTTPSAP